MQMDLKASDLKKKSNYAALIKDNAEGIIKMIKEEIIKAHSINIDYCDVKIPSKFNITNMTQKEAQLYITYEVIKKLENDGFKVQIDLQNNDPIWRISGWKKLSDDITESELLSFIASRTLQVKKKSNIKSNFDTET